MWAEFCIQTQIDECWQLATDWVHFACNIQTHRHRLVGLCLPNVGLQSRKHIQILCFVLGKQCRSRKLNHPDKTDIYNGQNSVLDTFVSDPQMSEHTYPECEDFSVNIYIYIYIHIYEYVCVCVCLDLDVQINKIDKDLVKTCFDLLDVFCVCDQGSLRG